MKLVEDLADLDFSQHGKHAEALVSLAVELGYTVGQNPKRFILLQSPIVEKIVRLPPTGRQMNEARDVAIFRSVVRYGDPERLKNLDGHLVDRLPANVQRLLPTAPRRSSQPVPELTHTIGDAVSVQPKKQPEPVATRTFELTPIASGSPILKRTWSGGAVDFVCGLEGCNYSGTTVPKVSGHIGHAAVHRDYVVQRMAERGETPKGNRGAKARRTVPEHTLLEQVTAPAREAATAPVERPTEVQSTTWNAESVLANVVRLVAPDLQAECARLGAQVRVLTEQLDEMTKRAEAAEERWGALRDLISQEP